MESTGQGYWWKKRLGSPLHDEIFKYVEHLKDIAATEKAKDKVHSVLYHNDYVFSGPYAAALRLLSAKGFSPVRLNVSKNIVDTLTAKIGKNHPAIKCATDGAEWSFRLKGKRIGKFVNAKLDETAFTRIAPLLFRDACIRGTGIVKISTENGEILPERVEKDDLLVDPLEARYGKPRQLHQTYFIAREVVMELFPEAKADIVLAHAADPEEAFDNVWMRNVSSSTNMIPVIESWHLPSGPEAGDGRHVICIEGRTLLHEEWTRPRFPFAFIHWSSPDKGFWGTGLIEELAPIQWEIDNIVQCIQESFQIGGKLKVFLARNSKIVKTQLGNKIGAITEFSGQPPIFHAPNPVSSQMFEYLRYLSSTAFELAGLSQMSAQSKLPPRMGDSAVAIQTFYDIETERFSQQALAYRNFYLDVAELFVDAAKDLYQDNENYSGNWVDRSLVEKIRWADVDLKRDQFKLKLEAVNLVPETRSGKISTLKELTQIGILPQQILGPNISSPDLERVYATINAAYNNMDSIVEAIENIELELPEPEPFHDLGLGINLIKAAYNENQAAGAPEEVLERFREWLVNAQAVIKSSQAPQGPQTAPAAPPVEAGAVAAPMPTPAQPAPVPNPIQAP